MSQCYHSSAQVDGDHPPGVFLNSALARKAISIAWLGTEQRFPDGLIFYSSCFLVCPADEFRGVLSTVER